MPRVRNRVEAMLTTAVVLVLAFAFALVGCSSAEEEQVSDAAVAESSSASVAATARASEEVTLGFVGDVCLADNYIPMQTLAEKGSTSIFDGIDPRYLREMRLIDIMWANNEFVYGSGPNVEPLEGKEWTFLAEPANVRYLGDMGVDLAGLANNHVFDYGEDAFLQTLDTLKGAGIPYVGAGRTSAEANAPVVLEANGIKVAYVAASCAENTIYTPEAGEDTPGIMWCYEDGTVLDAIQRAAGEADYVVVLPHWGIEHSTELEEKQIESSRAYIDAGADAVVGGHSHILQGIEFYQGKPILYNLGNFWFDGYDIDTVMAELVLKKGEDGAIASEVVLLPGTQSEAYTRWAPDESERNRIFRYIEEISYDAVSIDDAGHVSPAV